MRQKQKKFLAHLLVFSLVGAFLYLPQISIVKTKVAQAAAVTADPGTLAGSTSACSNSGGAWVNPTNAQTSNGAYATFGGSFFDNNEVSDALALSNFGFSLPDGSTIDGFLVEIEGYSPDGAGTGEISLVRLTKTDGTGTGSDLEPGANPMEGSDPASYADAYGDSTNLWGTTWSEAEVEASGFGVVLCFMANGPNRDISIDHIRITVYYTEQVSGVTVSGNVYSDEGSTGLANARTIALKVNGGATHSLSTTTIASTGRFDFFSVNIASPGDVITVFLDEAAEDAVAITRATSTADNITGLNLYQDRVIVRHEDPGPITISNLNQYDSEQDSDIPFIATTSPTTSLTVNDLTKLIIWTGKTFTPGGSITTSPSGAPSSQDGDIAIQSSATLSMGSNGLSVGGDFNSAGMYSISGGQTTTYTATSTGFSLGTSFENLTLNGSGGGWSTSSAVTIAGDLTVTAGTLSGTNGYTVNGGDATGNGTINLTGGSFLLDGTGNFGGASAWAFNQLTFGDGSGSATTTSSGSGGITASATTTVASNQVLNAGSKTWALSGNGTPLAINGSFTASTSTFSFASTGTTGTTFPALSYYNLAFNKSGNIFTASSGSLSILGDLTVTAGTLNLTANDPTVTVTGNLSNSGTLQASNINSLTFRGNWTNTGTFTNNGGTVVASPNSTSASISGMNNASAAFFNFTANSAGKALKFKEVEATYFSGNVNIFGQQGNPIEIRSQVSGSQWLLNLTGSMSVNSANVRDSGCNAGTINPGLGDRVYNQGNNGSCWGFIKRGKVQDPVEGGSGGGTPTTGGEPGDGGTPPTGGGSGGGGSEGGGSGSGGGGGSP